MRVIQFSVSLFFVLSGLMYGQKDTLVSIYPQSKSDSVGIYQKITKNNYKGVYQTPISVKKTPLDQLFGGLLPIKTEVSNQNRILIAQNKSGVIYKIMPLYKNQHYFFDDTAYQDRYRDYEVKGVIVENFMLNLHTTTHPYGVLTLSPLCKEIDIANNPSTLVYIPKDSFLKEGFEGGLCMIQKEIKTTSTSELLPLLTTTTTIDEKAYLRARLFDFITGDKDRKSDEWNWISEVKNEKTVFYPIPKDRSFVFSNYEGYLGKEISKIYPVTLQNKMYTYQLPNLKKTVKNGLSLDKRVIHSLTVADFYEQAEFLKNQLTDELINRSFESIPKEVIDYQWVETKRILQYRRDNLLKIAKEFHQVLSDHYILQACSASDQITVNRIGKGKTSIQMRNSGGIYFEATYDKKYTKEIWIYTLEGDDEIQFVGEDADAISIKIIGGEGNDFYKIPDPNQVQVFDEKGTLNTIQTSGKLDAVFTHETETNLYGFDKRKSNSYKLVPAIGSNPDDGLFLGIRNKVEFANFRQKPFSHSHQLDASYYTFTQGYDVKYKGIHAALVESFRVFLEAQMTSPNYANNYFGYGNEQQKGGFVLDYYRYRLSTYSLAVGLTKLMNSKSTIDAKVIIESKKMAHLQDRFLSSSPLEQFERNAFLGIDGVITYEEMKGNIFPTKGYRLKWQNGIQSNINYINKTFGYSIPSAEYAVPVVASQKFIFVTCFKAHLIVGNENNLLIYQRPSIGGDDGLRGFNNERFTGFTTAYSSSDIRYHYKQSFVGILPMSWGFYTGFDAGRVWIKNDTSKKIHTSFGVGSWLKVAEAISGQAGLFFSSDGPRFTFGIRFKV